jgi:hypothetical protein
MIQMANVLKLAMIITLEPRTSQPEPLTESHGSRRYAEAFTVH